MLKKMSIRGFIEHLDTIHVKKVLLSSEDQTFLSKEPVGFNLKFEHIAAFADPSLVYLNGESGEFYINNIDFIVVDNSQVIGEVIKIHCIGRPNGEHYTIVCVE